MLKIIKGDLLKSKDQFIAHQTNCISTGAAGLAASIFRKYPYSNIYTRRQEPSIPGTIAIDGDGINNRFIIHIMGQNYPGSFNEFETQEMRLNWFKNCLNEISLIDNLHSIGFPYMIGCGLAGGNWNDYYNLIYDFSENLNIDVNIYRIWDFDI
jgi:O-acetyl-ADP-ribose deacetylase (regulator of RNase III)